MKTAYKICLDLSLPENQHHLKCHTGEGGTRSIECSFCIGEEPYSISAAATAAIRAKRADGSFVYNDCTISGDKVIYEFTDGFLAVAGISECQITLCGADGRILASPRFILEVLPLVLSDEIIESENDFSALTTAKTAAESAAQFSEMYAKTSVESSIEALNSAAEAEMHMENARLALNDATAAIDDYFKTAQAALTAPPVLLASGMLENSDADIRFSFPEKVYGEISIYLTVPPSEAARSWGFYTYFDGRWVHHQNEGILTDRNSNIRINARFDGGQWIMESSKYYSSVSETAGWSANSSVITRGKSTVTDVPYIQSLRFVTDYNTSYSPAQIPFPKGTHWEVYGRKIPESIYLSPIGTFRENVELIKENELSGEETITLTGTPLKNKAIVYIEIPSCEKTFGAYLRINNKIAAQIPTLSEEGKNVCFKAEIEFTGMDFSVKVMQTASLTGYDWHSAVPISAAMKTALFGGTDGVINSIAIIPYEDNLFPAGTKITLHGIRVG